MPETIENTIQAAANYVVQILAGWEQGDPPFLGTGIILDSHRVITAAHVVTSSFCPFFYLKTSVDSALIKSTHVIIDDTYDLAIIEFTIPTQVAIPQLIVDVSTTHLFYLKQSTLVIYGYSRYDLVTGLHRYDAKSILPDATASPDKLQELQLDGGLHEGTSGGPVLIHIKDRYYWFGLAFRGGKGSKTSYCYAGTIISAFLEKHEIPFPALISASRSLFSSLSPTIPFLVVDYPFISEQTLSTLPFVARMPEWSDVTISATDDNKFIERDDTTELIERILKELIVPLRDETDPYHFHALFVTGSPGSGKTTLVRRVAAQLVETEGVVILDTGVGFTEPRGAVDDFLVHVRALTADGTVALLLLDDPLREDSEWTKLLLALHRPGLRLGVLAATPTLLYDYYHQELRDQVILHRFDIAHPSERERAKIAKIHGRNLAALENIDSDFLVLSMCAAEGLSFRDIIERLWVTLNHGTPLNVDVLNELSWTAHAFLIVLFFDHLYVPCPESLLAVLLRKRGDIADNLDVSDSLARLRHQNGWHFFRVVQQAKPGFAHRSALLSAAHHLIAQQAWEQRPLKWCNLAAHVAMASAAAPETIRYVVELAIRLRRSDETVGSLFMKQLIGNWVQVAAQIETRYISELVRGLSRQGFAPAAAPLASALASKALYAADGWMAVQGLWFLSPPDKKQDISYEELKSIIDAADFSLSPNRAVRFANGLNWQGRELVKLRILQSLDGHTEWKIDGYLLTWLLEKAQVAELEARLSIIETWMKEHREATDVRTKFLDFVQKLPADVRYDTLKQTLAKETLTWLQMPDNLHVMDVRTKHLYFLRTIAANLENASLLVEVVEYTWTWLQHVSHEFDCNVRTQYLAVLQRLVPIVHGHSSLNQFAQTVSMLVEMAVPFIRRWLVRHSESTDVRTQFLHFVCNVRSGEKVSVLEEAVSWLETGKNAPDVASTLLKLSVEHAPTELLARILKCCCERVQARGWDKSDQTILDAIGRPYARLQRDWSNSTLDAERVATLSFVGWCINQHKRLHPNPKRARR